MAIPPSITITASQDSAIQTMRTAALQVDVDPLDTDPLLMPDEL